MGELERRIHKIAAPAPQIIGSDTLKIARLEKQVGQLATECSSLSSEVKTILATQEKILGYLDRIIVGD